MEMLGHAHYRLIRFFQTKPPKNDRAMGIQRNNQQTQDEFSYLSYVWTVYMGFPVDTLLHHAWYIPMWYQDIKYSRCAPGFSRRTYIHQLFFSTASLRRPRQSGRSHGIIDVGLKTVASICFCREKSSQRLLTSWSKRQQLFAHRFLALRTPVWKNWFCLLGVTKHIRLFNTCR